MSQIKIAMHPLRQQSGTAADFRRAIAVKLEFQFES